MKYKEPEYHLLIPSGMHRAAADALVAGGDEANGYTVATAAIAVGAALKWHLENPLVPITREAA